MNVIRKIFWDNELWRVSVSTFIGVGLTVVVSPQPPEAFGGELAEWFLATISMGFWMCTAFSVVTMMVKPVKKKDLPTSSGEDTSAGA